MANPILLSSIAEIGDFLGVDVLNPKKTDWMILDGNTNQVIITPDTVPAFEYNVNGRISDFPLQRGAFASYNKVQMPYEIRMTLVCSGLNFVQQTAPALSLNFGNQFMQKDDFLDTLEYMRTTTDLFTIVTPDQTYTNANLERYDYRRETNRGANVLYVDCMFREIRQVVTSNSSVDGLPNVNSSSPSADNPVNNGILRGAVTVSIPNGIGTFQ